MARPPLLLLPPSEGKAAGGTGAPWGPGSMVAPELDERRAKAMVALARAMKGSGVARGKLLGVKGVALDAATEANREVATAPTLPAIDRYTGVLYDALCLPARGRPRSGGASTTQVRILSGLWGVVAPGDPIPDYKLKMGASIGPARQAVDLVAPGGDRGAGRRGRPGGRCGTCCPTSTPRPGRPI